MIRLFGPLLYLRVWHPTKFIIDIVLPISFASLITYLQVVSSGEPRLIGDESISMLSLPLLGALSGFFIAALTAVSAFPMNTLDEEMPGDKIVWYNKTTSNPSRREFLSLQFGYLAYISLILFTISVIINYLSSYQFVLPFKKLNCPDFVAFLHWLATFLYLFVILNIVFVTVFSVYYLSIKIHEEPTKLSGGPPDRQEKDTDAGP